MILIIKREVASRIGYKMFTPFGVKSESWESWRDQHEIDLGSLSKTKLDELETLLNRFKNVRGTQVLLTDILSWRKVLAEGVSTQKARTVRQFETLLQQYLVKAPSHWLYRRHEEGVMLAYYVSEVQYHPPVERSGDRTPAMVTMELTYESIGGTQSTGVNFYDADCRNVPVAQALADKSYVVESPELRADYEAARLRYVEVCPQVGRQFWAWGRGFLRSRYDSKTVQLDKDGERARIVVDIFFEDDEKPDRERSRSVSPWYWANIDKSSTYEAETDEDSNLELDEDTEVERPEVEIPIHPWVVVFHLDKHIRLRTHVSQLEEYIYDKRLADKLVLPAEQKSLVQLLIETKGGMFQDIVRGKGGGAVVLLTGQPGTGKTLTAEVYAESEERALYSVQCSQLGLNPEDLEESLMKVFERAKRWNAVMLLDEADVYVHERGFDMNQNAIVGVFLRVLEYRGTILFLTTNRPEDVDDAIASRCIARLNYLPPDSVDAKKIWRVLADVAGVKIAAEVIQEVVEDNPEMTGRDIKNILKLASLMEGAKEGVTEDMIYYVQQFKPTGAVALHEPKQEFRVVAVGGNRKVGETKWDSLFNIEEKPNAGA